MSNWTILVFMAADNDLDRYALKDIHEMEKYGSNEFVNVVVQIDRYGNGESGVAKRGLIKKNTGWARRPRQLISNLESIGETNTGDPDTLSDFIKWGVRAYPADRYALIVWNHGSGWKPEFIYEKVKETVGEDVSLAMRSADFAGKYRRRTNRIFFRKTAEFVIERFFKNNVSAFETLENGLGFLSDENRKSEADDWIVRAIGLDESSNGDALDSIELERAIKTASDNLRSDGVPQFKLSLVGFDACLMAGIETAFQIKEYASYMVGSEDVEPAVGWRYDQLLEKLTNVPAISSEDLAKCIVETYIKGMVDYRIKLVTLSAIKLDLLGEFVSVFEVVTNNLLTRLDSDYSKLAKSEKRCTRFFDKDMLDIGDYCRLLALNIGGEFSSDIEDLLAVYEKLIILSKYDFSFNNEAPTGLSIYYPNKSVFEDAFLNLKFSTEFPEWAEFVKKYHFII